MNEKKAEFCVALAVTGGIAVYKAAEVLRALQREGCRVKVAMTKHAAEFVSPLTFRALSYEPVVIDDYDPANQDPIAHINYSQNADLLLVVPATANSIAKFANGIADDFVSTTLLASTAPVLIAPAMNTTMWENAATQRNISFLKETGVRFVEPNAGELACGTVGIGKLSDVENIARQAMEILRGKSHSNDLEGESFLITVGGTREALDPVRFISNHSSGKMGFAIAQRAQKRGAKVTIVIGSHSAPVPNNCEVVEVVSAQDMYEAVSERFSDSTVFVGAAAVADYRPKKPAATKIKKTEADEMVLELEKTPDILATVAAQKTAGQIVAGFAAETTNVLEYAEQKLERKKLDLVVANDITKEGAGFNSDTNIATIIVRGKTESTELPKMSKLDLADRILDEIAALRAVGKSGATSQD
ncbi:MAG: bifunctional phosphopantothenoylcysteine decarboxylase/phosphopantothenate--cysteine ligase CoaBC [Pyrinomonadaceae bacterium]